MMVRYNASEGIQIILGPRLELHTGIHGELARSPPPGVIYVLPCHRHRFLAPPNANPFDPCRVFTLSETVQFALRPDETAIIHSSRVPVFNRVPWLADADCLLATLSSGTLYALNSRVVPEEGVIRVRQRLMLSHYLSDHCMGLLFRTNYARKNLLTFVESRRLIVREKLESLHQKTDVLTPTLPALPYANIATERLTIIYMGRFELGKGAEVASELFRRLHIRYGHRLRLVYVGPLPPGGQIDSCVEYFPVLDRDRYLGLLAGSHIYLAPTEFESFGFGLIEAARVGLAIVTSSGPGMEHIEELFQHDVSALLVPTDLSVSDRVAAFEANLRSLVDDREKLCRIRIRCLEMFKSGALSLERRNKKLLAYYGRMIEAAHQRKVSPSDVPNGCRAAQARLGLALHVLSDEECITLRSRQTNPPRRALVTG